MADLLFLMIAGCLRATAVPPGCEARYERDVSDPDNNGEDCLANSSQPIPAL